MNINDLTAAARSGEASSVRAAARLMSIVADDPPRVVEVLQAARRTGLPSPAPFPRLLLGITGPPGSGKSTLTDAMVRELRSRRKASRIGVIAIDPSSPFTGGAVLGDRVRMMRHATDRMVFVRSMASRGQLGGLTLGVKGVVFVMGMIGCEVVVLETVGVGQSEVDVAGTADVVGVVFAPGQGDSIQLLKAGLMEIGDLLIVNKADRPEAARLHAQLLAMLDRSEQAVAKQLRKEPARCHGLEAPAPRREKGSGRRAFLASAVANEGIPEIVDTLEKLIRDHGDEWADRRGNAWREEVRLAILNEANRRLSRLLSSGSFFDDHVQPVLDGSRSLDEVVSGLFDEAGAPRGQTTGGRDTNGFRGDAPAHTRTGRVDDE